MSLKEIKQIKTTKYFRRWDLIVYLALLLAAGAIFIFLIFSDSRRASSDYLEIRCRGQIIGIYDFEEDSLTAQENCESMFETEEQTELVLVRISPTPGEYNVLQINKTDRTVDMTDSNCSQGKDCTHMHIGRAGQTIVCVPHALVIEGVSKNGKDDGVIIG